MWSGRRGGMMDVPRGFEGLRSQTPLDAAVSSPRGSGGIPEWAHAVRVDRGIARCQRRVGWWKVVWQRQATVRGATVRLLQKGNDDPDNCHRRDHRRCRPFPRRGWCRLDVGWRRDGDCSAAGLERSGARARQGLSAGVPRIAPPSERRAPTAGSRPDAFGVSVVCLGESTAPCWKSLECPIDVPGTHTGPKRTSM